MKMKREVRDRLMAEARKAQNNKCPVCGYGDFCWECERGKGPGFPHEHKHQTLNTFDHDHSYCEYGCEKCFRGALHQFCNNRILPVWEGYFRRYGFVEKLPRRDREVLLIANPGWAKFGYIERFDQVREYLKRARDKRTNEGAIPRKTE